MIIRILLVAAAALGSAFASRLHAEPPAVNGTMVLSGLDSPRAIAVQPTTFDWFISEGGSGRIVRFTPSGTAKEPQPVITGFAVRDFGENPAYKIGPLGLAFIDKDTLVVGGGDLGPGADLVRIYAVPPVGKSIPVEETKVFSETKPGGKLGPLPAVEPSKTGEGNFFSVAVNLKTGNLYALGQGDPDKGWIVKADLIAGKPGDLKRYLSTKKESGYAGAFALTQSERGELVVGTRGEPDTTRSAMLTFFHKNTGKALLSVRTGLNEIVALAYSKKTGYLYALDMSTREPDQGGLYRLDDDGQGGVKPFKIAALDRPTAMAFTGDGMNLLVTILGKFPTDSNDKPGQVIKFMGL